MDIKLKWTLFVIIVTLLLIFFIYKINSLSTKTFTSSNGREGEYLIYPIKNSKGILLWLHGDGAFEYFNPESKDYLEGSKGIRQVAKEKNLTLVVPKTPSTKYDTWWEEGDLNSDYLTDLIHSLPNYDYLWIGGFSSGAEITSYWLIEKLKDIDIKEGGAVLFGGGGSPKVENISDRIPKKIITGDFPIYWIVGEYDTGNIDEENPFDALTASKEGEEFYRTNGWKTNITILDNYSHLLTKNNEGKYGEFLDEIIPER